METHEAVTRLQAHEDLTSSEILTLWTSCQKVVSTVFKRYGLDKIIRSPSLREEMKEEIVVMSFIRALRDFNPQRGVKFLTYFYYKASSTARGKQQKYYKREALINTRSLNESVEIGIGGQQL